MLFDPNSYANWVFLLIFALNFGIINGLNWDTDVTIKVTI